MSARAWALILLFVGVLASAVVVRATYPVTLHTSTATLLDRLLPPVR